YSYSVSRTAVTNVSAEVLTLIARGKNSPGPGQSPLNIIEITASTAGSAGIQQIVQLPRVGRLLGLLCFFTTVPTATADVGTYNHMMIDLNDLPWSSVGLDD